MAAWELAQQIEAADYGNEQKFPVKTAQKEKAQVHSRNESIDQGYYQPA
jgi:hypothetical protein